MGKVCVLLPTHWEAGKGGAEYQADKFSDYLQQTGNHEVVYLARYIGDVKNYNYKISKIPRFFKSERYGQFFDSFGLLGVLDEINPDVILQHVSSAYTGVAAYYCKKNNKSMVWYLASDSDVEKLSFSFAPKKWPGFIDKLFLIYGIKNSTKIIAQTQKQAILLEENYNQKVHDIIPNFHPPANGIPDKGERMRVLWIANIKTLKQPEIFIQMAKDCSDKDNIEFKIIGRREKSQWCDELLDDASLIKNFEYVGELDIEGVNEQLDRAHLLVNTSLYEGFPNTFIQAWIREVPTLSLNVDPDGVITKFDLGLYAKTYENMIKYVLDVSQNLDELRNVGRRAKENAIENYSMKNADRLIDVIESEISAKINRY